ncbi:MAG: long-chain fatty acid--CoA ligase [Bradymonadaceae bacterium]
MNDVATTPVEADRDTIVDRFFEKVGELGVKPALYHKAGEDWESLSWADYGRKCREFAGALIASGYEPDDKVAICAYNCPEWVVADVGAMVGRAVPVGIYHTNSPDEVAYIARHSESKVLVVENEEQWQKVDQCRDEIPDLERIVMIEEAGAVDDEMVISFADFLEEGREHLEAVEDRYQSIDPDDVATMIYTSGTTGDPKGVMLTHENLSFTASTAVDVLGGVQENECMVSYLPLSHIAEQMFSIHLALTFGYPIWFAEDIYEVKDALLAARPTVFFGVPRIWEKFKSALESKLQEATGLKAKLVEWCRDVGLEAGYQMIEDGEVSGLTALKYKIADRLFFTKLKEKLGLDRLRIAISAAAPIGVDVLEFFLSCDIIIREVYGQSEDCGPTTVNFPEAGKTELGTVGLPMPGVEVRIADEEGIYEGEPEGEILVKGNNVFKGYFKDPEATEETMEDGWLKSGDIGRFDEDGFLEITGRKKEIIITAGGKNVAPQKIESNLKELDGIGNAVVIGDRRKYLTALLSLDPDRAPAMAESKGWPTDFEGLVDHPEFQDYVHAHVDEVNKKLAQVETIKKFTVLPTEFSQETDEMTPTQKVKRRVVEDKYGDEIDAMYPD